MRDWMFLAGIMVLFVLGTRSAFVAFLAWGWTASVAIDGYVYGFMQTARANMIFGLLTLTMVFLKRDRLRGTAMTESGTFILLVCFLVHATLCVMFAYPDNHHNLTLYDKLYKTMLFALIMPLVVVGRQRIHATVIMLCLSVSIHGVIEGLKFIASGGGHNVVGLPKFGDNNHFALIIATSIPFLLYLARYSKSKLVRVGVMGAAVLTVGAVVGTNSRGGLLTLAVLALLAIVNSRQKMVGILIVLLAAGLVYELADTKWIERMDTIKEADQDDSFQQRLEAWQVSSAIALRNPVFGAGLHGLQVQSVWDIFRGQTGILPFVTLSFQPSQTFRAAHSIYFEVMGDMGFVGFFLFMALLINCLLNGRRVRKLAERAKDQNLSWAVELNMAINNAMIAFMLGGASVSLAYTETLYFMIMLSEVLRREVQMAVEAPRQIAPA